MPTHVISANGTPADETTGDVQVPIFKRKTILTDAQIKDLQNTPVELVPAPGTDKVILVHKVIYKRSLSAIYTNILSDDTIFVRYGSTSTPIVGGFIYEEGVYNELPKLLAPQVAPTAVGLFCEIVSAFVDATSGYLKPLTIPYNPNEAVNLYGFGSWTGGHASNTLEVTVFYSIVDL